MFNVFVDKLTNLFIIEIILHKNYHFKHERQSELE